MPLFNKQGPVKILGQYTEITTNITFEDECKQFDKNKLKQRGQKSYDPGHMAKKMMAKVPKKLELRELW